VGCERTSVATAFGRPYTLVGLVSDTGNFIAVAIFSGVKTSYRVYWLNYGGPGGTRRVTGWKVGNTSSSTPFPLKIGAVREFGFMVSNV